MRNVILSGLSLLAIALAGCVGQSPPTLSGTIADGPLNDQTIVPQDMMVGALRDVCHLQVQRRKSARTGSGVLIEGRYLITAAHNVADVNPFNRVRQIDVRCGVTNAMDAPVDVSIQADELGAKRFVPAYRGWAFRTSERTKHDYAFLDLGTELTSEGSFVLGRLEQCDTVNGGLILAGYPGGDTRIAGGYKDDGYKLYQGEGLYRGMANAFVFSFGLNTFTGNSGGPIWCDAGGQETLIGVLVSGSSGRGPGFGRAVDEAMADHFGAFKRTRQGAG